MKVGASFFYYGTLSESWSMCLRDPAFYTAINILLTFIGVMISNYKTDPMTNNLEYDLQFGFGDVKLWVLRHGEKMSDLELLTKLLGY